VEVRIYSSCLIRVLLITNEWTELKEKRRSTEQRERDSNSFLRIGSLNVRVKKTTEAFGNFIGKSNSASNIERILNKKWGSTESLPETEVHITFLIVSLVFSWLYNSCINCRLRRRTRTWCLLRQAPLSPTPRKGNEARPGKVSIQKFKSLHLKPGNPPPVQSSPLEFKKRTVAQTLTRLVASDRDGKETNWALG